MLLNKIVVSIHKQVAFNLAFSPSRHLQNVNMHVLSQVFLAYRYNVIKINVLYSTAQKYFTTLL